MRGWLICGFSLIFGAALPAAAEPALPGASSASACAEVSRARVQLASDRRSHQQKLDGIERGLQARRVRHQLRTELLRAQLRKQYKSGVALKPEQEQDLIASEKLAREMGSYSADEQQQITRTRQSLSRLEGNYRQKHGSAWTECPRQAAAAAGGADTYALAQHPSP